MQKKSAIHDWHTADIKAALAKKGLTLRALSVANNMHPDSLKNALRVSYPRGERIIAAAIGVPPETIWAERYSRRTQQTFIPAAAIGA